MQVILARRRKGYGYLKSMKIMEQEYHGVLISPHIWLSSTTSQGTSAQTNIGDDQSGNGNNFAVYNLATGDIVPDTPENNFPVMNNLVDTQTHFTFTEGNLKVRNTASKHLSSNNNSICSYKW